MIAPLLVSILFGVVAQESVPPVAPAVPEVGATETPEEVAAKAQLSALAERIATASSYTLSYDPDVTNNRPGEVAGSVTDPTSARGGARNHEKSDIWAIHFARREATEYARGRADFYMRDQKIVALGRAEKWSVIELPEAGAQHEQLRGMQGMAADIRRVLLPHRFFAAFSEKVAHVAIEPAEPDAVARGTLVFSAKLTLAAARELATGNRGKRAEPQERAAQPRTPEEEDDAGTPAPPSAPKEPKAPDGDGPPGDDPSPPGDGDEAGDGKGRGSSGDNLPWSGTIRVTALGESIEALDVVLVRGEGSKAKRLERRYALSAVNSTKVEIPKPALELLLAK